MATEIHRYGVTTCATAAVSCSAERLSCRDPLRGTASEIRRQGVAICATATVSCSEERHGRRDPLGLGLPVRRRHRRRCGQPVGRGRQRGWHVRLLCPIMVSKGQATMATDERERGRAMDAREGRAREKDGHGLVKK